MKRLEEWWLTPIDAWGDSMEIFFCDTLEEAIKEKELRENDYPQARWQLEKVIRYYLPDGHLIKEDVRDKTWI